MQRSFTERVRRDEGLREELSDALRVAIAGPIPGTRDGLERLFEAAARDPGLGSRLVDAVAGVAERHGFEVDGTLRPDDLARVARAANPPRAGKPGVESFQWGAGQAGG